MIRLPFTQVDAFATRPFEGNPAAVIPLDTWLDDATLQAIAQENNLAETAFAVKLPEGGEADHDLRWFTPVLEVALCGHATLATAHVLLGEGEEIRFRTRRSGVLAVSRAGAGYELSLPALPATPRALPDIAKAMGGDPVETLWHEGGYAVLVYPDEAAIRALAPDLGSLRPMGDIAFIATAPGAASDIVSRVFVPGAGIDEDPVTGSAHAVLTPYWAQRLGRPAFSACQASARGGHLICRTEGTRVVLGGTCVTVIEGVMTIPA